MPSERWVASATLRFLPTATTRPCSTFTSMSSFSASPRRSTTRFTPGCMSAKACWNTLGSKMVSPLTSTKGSSRYSRTAQTLPMLLATDQNGLMVSPTRPGS